MGILKRLGKQKRALAVPQARLAPQSLDCLSGFASLKEADLRLYDALRESIPVIDAAVNMCVRLCGGFTLKGDTEKVTARLKEFCRTVRVGSTGQGMDAFLTSYLDSLLTYGNAVAEVVPTFDETVCRLYPADLKNLVLSEKNGGTEIEISVKDFAGNRKVRYPDLLAFTALNPPSGHGIGVSVLRGLPFVSNVLLNVFSTVEKNWDKAGCVRYAVTYKPGADPLDRAYAKERAEAIAEEWSRTVNETGGGDFVAVGDVSVKVIGAESPIPDSTVPVRQMLEQIVAKLGVPPYILGLSWAATERMSGEQADNFTSLLTSYRRAVTPAIEKTASLFLRLAGIHSSVTVEWDDINLRDELSEAQAAYYRARAALSEQENNKETEA